MQNIGRESPKLDQFSNEIDNYWNDATETME